MFDRTQYIISNGSTKDFEGFTPASLADLVESVPQLQVKPKNFKVSEEIDSENDLNNGDCGFLAVLENRGKGSKGITGYDAYSTLQMYIRWLLKNQGMTFAESFHYFLYDKFKIQFIGKSLEKTSLLLANKNPNSNVIIPHKKTLTKIFTRMREACKGIPGTSFDTPEKELINLIYSLCYSRFSAASFGYGVYVAKLVGMVEKMLMKGDSLRVFGVWLLNLMAVQPGYLWAHCGYFVMVTNTQFAHGVVRYIKEIEQTKKFVPIDFLLDDLLKRFLVEKKYRSIQNLISGIDQSSLKTSDSMKPILMCKVQL